MAISRGNVKLSSEEMKNESNQSPRRKHGKNEVRKPCTMNQESVELNFQSDTRVPSTQKISRYKAACQEGLL
ncbi:hypothetical protein DAPPUDRAFT_320927 [Daphnia pulex]|uniref:Uncharacterized protein n=1 Tax=Daphnia pulex TaxID=6669 RepID=E9GRG0_DAPPU|nr:hypothetical protein DAPPUDRAFT_320927 [Daphnia pulex]|eukprot:EFX77922.1 hypothetical protein DAPPUDRAFT_320927 [Daphnia pulex]